MRTVMTALLFVGTYGACSEPGLAQELSLKGAVHDFGFLQRVGWGDNGQGGGYGGTPQNQSGGSQGGGYGGGQPQNQGGGYGGSNAIKRGNYGGTNNNGTTTKAAPTTTIAATRVAPTTTTTIRAPTTTTITPKRKRGSIRVRTTTAASIRARAPRAVTAATTARAAKCRAATIKEATLAVTLRAAIPKAATMEPRVVGHRRVAARLALRQSRSAWVSARTLAIPSSTLSPTRTRRALPLALQSAIE